MGANVVAGALRLGGGHRHPLPDARRVDPEVLASEVGLVAASPVVSALLEAVSATLLVINSHRQVVAVNAAVHGGEDASRFAGLRAGEVLGCANASGAGGCGTVAACETCGALGAVLGCERAHRPVEAECLLTTERGTSVELHVRATPVEVNGNRFTVVAMRDISAEKRKEALEQIFFHDVLNTVTGLRGWAAHLVRPGASAAKAGERIDVLSRQLEREIKDHRNLVLAEAGALAPVWAPLHARDLLFELEGVFAQHAVARDRILSLEEPSPELELTTDRALLARILVNLVKNAFEATPPGARVRVSCAEDVPGRRGSVSFAVHNGGAIPGDVQPRIFQRSFSTKAARGRGLGTYGARLLCERYLGGDLSFRSTREAGTTFTVRLPRQPADDVASLAGGRGTPSA
jgi:signal transduction histidine kinase